MFIGSSFFMTASNSQIPTTGKQQDFGRSWCSWILGAACFWVPAYYLLFHLLIGIPVRLLYGPAEIQLAITVLVFPLAFAARKQFISSNRREFAMFYVLASLYFFCTVLCWAYFGLRVGVIPRDDQTVVYAIASFGSIAGPWGAYFVRKLAVRKPS
jgi:hypothetical protein